MAGPGGSKSIAAPKRNLPINHLVEDAGENTSHNLDYSGGSAEVIKYTAQNLVVITGLLVFVEDTGDFAPDKLGVDVTLTNGIEIKIYDADDNELHDVLDGLTLIDNYDFVKRTPDVQISANSGLKNVLVAYFNFLLHTKAFVLKEGEYLGITLDDDFSDLTDLTFTVIGYDGKQTIG